MPDPNSPSTEEPPTVIKVIHSPIVKTGTNAWGTALWYAYDDLVEAGDAKQVIVLSAPPTSPASNVPVLPSNVVYRQVQCPRSLFESAKAIAIDYYAWDQIHLMHPRGTEPFVCVAFDENKTEYDEAWKNFFLYSIETAISALNIGDGEDDPVFHLNDPHDSFVSALFENNYDEAWLKSYIGEEGSARLEQFKSVREKFLENHQQINHTRFWHVPSIHVDAFRPWFDRDPKVASHFLSGVISSPLNVHAEMWKTNFDKLLTEFGDQVNEQLNIGSRTVLENGIGVGPIGYDPKSFIKRFEDFDHGGDSQRTLDALNKWSDQIQNSLEDGVKPIVVFLTCRGDDPKNNLIETTKALRELAKDPEVAKRLVVISVFNSSRTNEQEIYQETLDGFKEGLGKLAELIGEDRTIIFEKTPTGPSNLPEQSAGFLLAAKNGMYSCNARGGFDVVCLEAAIVADLTANDRIASEFSEALNWLGEGSNFHLLMADTAGSAGYLRRIVPHSEIVPTTEFRMPTAEQIADPLSDAYKSVHKGLSAVEPGRKIIEKIENVCGARACISQWTDSAVEGNPQNHPRTFASAAAGAGLASDGPAINL